jgi:hypothetical protein
MSYLVNDLGRPGKIELSLIRIDSTALIILVLPTSSAVALFTSCEVTMSVRQQGHSSLLSSHSRIQSLWKT